MARVCDICGKGPQFGNNISHAHNKTKRRWNVNLRPVRARVKGATKRMRGHGFSIALRRRPSPAGAAFALAQRVSAG